MRFYLPFFVLCIPVMLLGQLPCVESSCDPMIALDPGYSPNIVEIGQTSKMTLDWEMLINDTDIGCAGTPAGSWSIQISFPNTYTYNDDVMTSDFSSSFSGSVLTLTNEDILSGASGTICYTVTANTNTNGVEDLTNINVFITPIFRPGQCVAAFGNDINNDVTNDGIIIAEATPVDLVYFQIKRKGEHAWLSWQTASEVNNDYFEIEQSVDGVHFESIGRVEGAGTYVGESDYEFIDRNPKLGVNYYRLSQVDLDGQYAYSPIRSLNFGNLTDIKLEFKYFPNPTSDQLNILASYDLEFHTIHLVDIKGQIQMIQAYQNGMILDLADLAEGIYYTRIMDSAGLIVSTQKIVKMLH